MNLGTFQLDDYLPIPANTHDPTNDGAATDADGSVVYRIYEQGNETPVASGTCSNISTGFYAAFPKLSSGSGFETGKEYEVYVTATVSSVQGTQGHRFRLRTGAEHYEQQDEFFPVTVNAHDPTDSSKAADATGSPAYTVYDRTGSGVTTGTLSKFDDASTLGYYLDRLELVAETFPVGTYVVNVSCVVGGVTMTAARVFKVDAPPGAIADRPGLSLSWSSPNVTVSFTAPVDADYSSSILYRQELGDSQWTIITTLTADEDYVDATVDAGTTYIYVAEPRSEGNEAGPPSREASIETRDAASGSSATGIYDYPLVALRLIAANSPAMQTFLGVATEADALARIYFPRAGQISSGAATSTSAGKLVNSGTTFQTNGVLAGDKVLNKTDDTETTVSSVDSETELSLADDIMAEGERYVVEVVRPLAVVHYPQDGIGHDVIADGTVVPSAGNEICIYFEQAIASGSEADGRQGAAWLAFTSVLSSISYQMMRLASTDDGNHAYMPLANVRLDQIPGRPERDEAEAGIGHAYGATLRFVLRGGSL